MAITNKQAIISYFNFEVPNLLVEKVIIDREVMGDKNYSSTDTEAVELAVADICLSLVNVASESEGGLSVNYDSTKLTALRQALLKKHGQDESGVGGISAKHPW